MKTGDTVNGLKILWMDNPFVFEGKPFDILIKVGEFAGIIEEDVVCDSCKHIKTKKRSVYNNVRFIRLSELNNLS